MKSLEQVFVLYCAYIVVLVVKLNVIKNAMVAEF